MLNLYPQNLQIIEENLLKASLKQISLYIRNIKILAKKKLPLNPSMNINKLKKILT